MIMENKAEGGKVAKARGLGLGISFKQAVEVCDFVRGKPVSAAVAYLGSVAGGKSAVPFRRFNRGGTGHRSGSLGPGRFPMKTASEIMRIVRSAEANARNMGLDSGKLAIVHIAANRGSKAYHYGRKRRRLMKRTHVEVLVGEGK